jgi:hypothetical protein
LNKIPPIPIFVISFNRLAVLKSTIDSYRQIEGTSIIIHDTGSTYAPLLTYLAELEREHVSVHYKQRPIIQDDDLNSVAITVLDWLSKHDSPYYVVTDPDVALEDGCEDILEFFQHLLDVFPDIDVVGPMLRIDDIPNSYPLKSLVIQRHTDQFWHKTPEWISWRGQKIAYQRATIDTTFGMYRRGTTFRRLCKGVRTYAPYWAKHLDWYIDPQNMTEDQIFYLQTASDVSHWSGAWLRESLDRQSSGLSAVNPATTKTDP